MRRGIAIGLILAVAAAIVGCGGGGGDDTSSSDGTAPTTGVQLAHGKCAADPDAQDEREAEVESGALSAKEAQIAELTEVRTCEVESNAVRLKNVLCAHDPADLLKEGKVSEPQAAQLEDLQKKVKC